MTTRSSDATRPRPGLRDFGPLVAGIGALALGTAVGWDTRVVEAIVRPPQIVRAGLAGIAVVAGIVLLARAVDRLGGPGSMHWGDLARMVRGVRLAFLSLAAFAAAAGWILGHPLPIVVALVIAGVDVLETSFLLLVVATKPGAESGRNQ